MAFDAHKNLAYSTIATAPSPALSGTTATLQTGDGAHFPAVPFNALIWPPNTLPLTSNAEIARVTAMSGDAITAMARATNTEPNVIGPISVLVGYQIAAVVSGKSLVDIETVAAAASTAAAAVEATTSTVSTTGNIAALALPSGNGPLVIYLTNASLATIQGIAAGLNGQELTLISQGAGQVDLPHANGSGVTGGKLHNIATSAPTSLAAGVGIARYVYDLTNTRWNLVAHEQGAGITPTFSATDWAGDSSMTWTVTTGNRLVDTYYLHGRQLTVNVWIDSSSVGGTPNALLRRNVPGGYTLVGRATGFIAYSDDGATSAIGTILIDGTNQFMYFEKVDASSWSAATSTTDVRGSMTFAIT